MRTAGKRKIENRKQTTVKTLFTFGLDERPDLPTVMSVHKHYLIPLK